MDGTCKPLSPCKGCFAAAWLRSWRPEVLGIWGVRVFVTLKTRNRTYPQSPGHEQRRVVGPGLGRARARRRLAHSNVAVEVGGPVGACARH